MKKTIQRSIGLGRVKIKAKKLKIIPPPPPLPPNQKNSFDSVDDEQDNEEEPTGSPFDPCEDDEDESTLLSGFNKRLLVLRDERVMRCVKYVSAAAPGSRWDSDICGEYEVGR